MSSSVEIYVRYSGDGSGLAHRAAEDFGALTYFSTGRSYVLAFQAEPWIGFDNWARLDLDPTDLVVYGEPGSAKDTALAPYEWEFSLSFRVGPPHDSEEVLKRLGRVVFHQLTTLGLPLVYGGNGLIFADFLPVRGIREFPPNTDVEEPGQDWWFEPRLHGQPREPWPVDVAPLSVPPANPVTVFVTRDALQFVPLRWGGTHWRWGTPRSSTLFTVRPREIGLLLNHARRTQPARAAESESILTVLAGGMNMSFTDYVSQSISIEIGTDADGLVAVPHRPRDIASDSRELLGPTLDGLVRRLPEPVRPEDLGEFLLSLISAARSELKAGYPRFGWAMTIHLAGTVDQGRVDALRSSLSLEREGRFDDDYDQTLGRREYDVEGGRLRILLHRDDTHGPWSFRVLSAGEPTAAALRRVREEIIAAAGANGLTVERAAPTGVEPRELGPSS